MMAWGLLAGTDLYDGEGVVAGTDLHDGPGVVAGTDLYVAGIVAGTDLYDGASVVAGTDLYDGPGVVSRVPEGHSEHRQSGRADRERLRTPRADDAATCRLQREVEPPGLVGVVQRQLVPGDPEHLLSGDTASRGAGQRR